MCLNILSRVCVSPRGYLLYRLSYHLRSLGKHALSTQILYNRARLITGSTTIFSCPTCHLQFDDFKAATQAHGVCVSWSCRCYHEDTPDSQNWTSCSFCNLSPCASGSQEYEKEPISRSAQVLYPGDELRRCSRDIFIDADEFARHLEDDHLVMEHTSLDAWQRVQFLEIIDGRGLIRTSRFTCPSRNCCQATQPSYNFTFVTL